MNHFWQIQTRAGEEFLPEYYGTFKETQQGHTGDIGNVRQSSLDPKPLITETVITVYILPEFVHFPADQVLQQSLSCPFCDILLSFFFSPWSAQDYLSLLKGNVTTSQSSPYWWVHILEFKASITKIIIQWLKSNLQVATGRFSLISSHLHLHSMSLGFKMPFFVLVCDYLG